MFDIVSPLGWSVLCLSSSLCLFSCLSQSSDFDPFTKLQITAFAFHGKSVPEFPRRSTIVFRRLLLILSKGKKIPYFIIIMCSYLILSEVTNVLKLTNCSFFSIQSTAEEKKQWVFLSSNLKIHAILYILRYAKGLVKLNLITDNDEYFILN